MVCSSSSSCCGLSVLPASVVCDGNTGGDDANGLSTVVRLNVTEGPLWSAAVCAVGGAGWEGVAAPTASERAKVVFGAGSGVGGAVAAADDLVGSLGDLAARALLVLLLLLLLLTAFLLLSIALFAVASVVRRGGSRVDGFVVTVGRNAGAASFGLLLRLRVAGLTALASGFCIAAGRSACTDADGDA